MCGTVSFLTRKFFNPKFILGLVVALTLFSCGNGTNNEGLCQYSDPIRVKMEIVEVSEDPNQEGIYEVTVEFDQSIFAEEPQSLGALRNEKITAEYLELNPFIHQGTILTGYVYEVIEGNCEINSPAFDQKFRTPD